MEKRMRKNGIYNLLVLIAVLFVSAMAMASGDGYALLIQSSPPDGGSVTPGMGVHRIDLGQTVALSAKPKQGYRFLYWLGDVSSTTGLNTTVSVDSPKLVVAVFAREDFDEELPGAGIIDGQYAPGAGRRGYNPIQSSGSVSPGVLPYDYDRNYIFPEFPETPKDIPVPGEETTKNDDDIPVPGDNEVPEPATILLLGMGSSILLKRRMRRK